MKNLKFFMLTLLALLAVDLVNAQIESPDPCMKDNTEVVGQTETLVGGGFGWLTYSVCTTTETTCLDTGVVTTSTDCKLENRYLGFIVVESAKETPQKYNDLASVSEDQYYDFQGRLIVGAGTSIGVEEEAACNTNYIGTITSQQAGVHAGTGRIHTTTFQPMAGYPGTCPVERVYNYSLDIFSGQICYTLVTTNYSGCQV